MKKCCGGLIVLNLMILVHSETYPTCGDCWCIPGKNGLGPCPIWQPQTSFSNETITGYLNQVILNPYSLDCNPYYDADCATTPTQDYLDLDTAICAFKYSDNSCGEYQLVTYPNRQEALKDHAVITHEGSCGLCSTASDLAVYLNQDFTQAGKICATKGLFNEDKGLECYMELGLTRECAKIWNYDGIYDGTVCGKTCAGDLTSPNNGEPPACELNECLQCDEVEAGPIFSSYGGRTRRRSGLQSEIIRPCESVARIFQHNPCPFD